MGLLRLIIYVYLLIVAFAVLAIVFPYVCNLSIENSTMTALTWNSESLNATSKILVVNLTPSTVLDYLYDKKFSLEVGNGTVILVENESGFSFKDAIVKALEVDAWNVTPENYSKLVDLYRIVQVNKLKSNRTINVSFAGLSLSYPSNWTVYEVSVGNLSALFAIERAYFGNYSRDLSYPPSGKVWSYYVLPVDYLNLTLVYGDVDVNYSQNGNYWLVSVRPKLVTEIWNGSDWIVTNVTYLGNTKTLYINTSRDGVYTLSDRVGSFWKFEPMVVYDIQATVSNGYVRWDKWIFNFTSVFYYDTKYQIGLYLTSRGGYNPYYLVNTSDFVQFGSTLTKSIYNNTSVVVFNYTVSPFQNRTLRVDVFVCDDVYLLEGVRHKIHRTYYVGNLTVFFNTSEERSGNLITIWSTERVLPRFRAYPPWATELMNVSKSVAETVYTYSLFSRLNDSLCFTNTSKRYTKLFSRLSNGSLVRSVSLNLTDFDKYLVLNYVLSSIRFRLPVENYTCDYEGKDLLEALYERQSKWTTVEALYALALKTCFYVNTSIRWIYPENRYGIVNYVIVNGVDRSNACPPYVKTNAGTVVLNIPCFPGGDFGTWIYIDKGYIKPLMGRLEHVGDFIKFRKGLSLSVLRLDESEKVARIEEFNTTLLRDYFKTAINYYDYIIYV